MNHPPVYPLHLERERQVFADLLLPDKSELHRAKTARVTGSRHLIAVTKRSRAIALVWNGDRTAAAGVLTAEIMDEVLDEAQAAGIEGPVFIYGTGNTAPQAPDLYRFVQFGPEAMRRVQAFQMKFPAPPDASRGPCCLVSFVQTSSVAFYPVEHFRGTWDDCENRRVQSNLPNAMRTYTATETPARAALIAAGPR